MNMKTLTVVLATAGILGAAGYGIYALGMQKGMTMAGVPSADKAGIVAPNDVTADPGGKKVLYWHDPMVPGQKFDKPGKSPFMDMQLVPVYAGDEGDEGKVVISPRVQQNLGIRTALVARASLGQTVEAVGSVAYNERDLVLVQARSNGFVERLYVRAPQDPVRKGQPLVDLYIPEWVAAQEEYLSVRDMQGTGADVFLDGARQRMRLVGMTDSQIRLVESSGKVQARVTLHSPVAGIVTELAVREGMTVMSGAPLFRINGLDTVWVNAEVPEALAANLKPGNLVEARAPALPGSVLKGKVNALLPEVNATTRTLKARVELANPGHRLVPGMFATLNFSPVATQKVLTIPTEAVIQTGRRSVVMVALEEGKFSPVDVETGAELDGKTEVRKGLEEGQKVVISGQFLIDSEASLKGTTTRMSEMQTGQDDQSITSAPSSQTSKVAPALHRGQGKVEAISKTEITLSHDPIPSLQWGAMTMSFKLPAQGLSSNVAVGEAVTFQLRAMKDGAFEVTSIAPVGATAAKETAIPGVAK